MTWPASIFVLLATYLAVYCEAAFGGVRHFLGAQVDLLPSLMVYAALCTDITTVAFMAVLGGLWFDSFSANPFGVTVLPLFAVGLMLHLYRDLILRDQPFAQATIGLAASAAMPVLTLLVLLTTGHKPMLGWGSLWQWLVMSFGGALATPVCFELFALLHRAFVHQGDIQSSFRPDREIRRGR